MLLVADIGNTNITFGVYQGEKLVKTFRLVSEKAETIEKYSNDIKKEIVDLKITKSIIGSVVEELDEKIKKAIDEVFNIKSFLFDVNSKTGVVLDVEKPKLVGADRVANAYAAYKKHSKACIIVDIGSATTFDIVSGDGRFFGGIIMPGIEMQLKALSEKTSKLPKIQIEEIDSVIGRDTKTCILSGVIKGHACAIEGLIRECKKEMKEEPIIIATGGLNFLVAKYMNSQFDYLEPNLTLEGFRHLYSLNIE